MPKFLSPPHPLTQPVPPAPALPATPCPYPAVYILYYIYNLMT